MDNTADRSASSNRQKILEKNLHLAVRLGFSCTICIFHSQHGVYNFVVDDDDVRSIQTCVCAKLST